MNHRDQEYIENRLMDQSSAMEAAGRLRQCGQDDLAKAVMDATQQYTEELRNIRRVMNNRAVRSRQGR